MSIDLHVHTNESDGTQSVKEVCQIAHKNNVNILSITDHESTEGIKEAERLSETMGFKVIPGVELLTGFKGHEVHLLGYYKSIENETLQKRLKELREQRTSLAYDMVKKLQIDGIPIEWRDVEREASFEGAISKGHIMRVLFSSRAWATENLTWREISGFFQPGGIAYLPFLNHPYEEAVDFIYDTGGFPVLAHPGLLQDQGIILELLKCRRTGLEVYYGYWKNREKLINYFAEIAKKYSILATGGSDYHGPFSQVELGQLDVPLTGVKDLQKYLSF